MEHLSRDGITICILDTGGSFKQDNIGSAFTQGNSGSRSVQKISTKYSGSWWWKSKDSPNDDCGHGTSMAGIATAPRGTDGNAVGVAYKSDLLTIRGSSDVLVNSSNEKRGVRDGLITAAERTNVKVISMSIGDVFYSSTVADGIYYAYNKRQAHFGRRRYFIFIYQLGGCYIPCQHESNNSNNWSEGW